MGYRKVFKKRNLRFENFSRMSRLFSLLSKFLFHFRHSDRHANSVRLLPVPSVSFRLFLSFHALICLFVVFNQVVLHIP